MSSRIWFILVLFILQGSISAMAEPSDSISTKPKSKNIISRVIHYFSETYFPDSTKKFDISFIGGPSYSSENKLSIGMIAAGLYRRMLKDTSIPAGQINIYGNVAITGYYKFGVNGIHYIDRNRQYIVYDLSFEDAPDKFWGIGYINNCNNSNETKYKRQHIKLDAEYLHKIGSTDLHVGPHLMLDYLKATHVGNPELWDNQRLTTFTNSLGVKFEYDTRDYRFNAYKGIYFKIDQMFAPKFLGNKYAFIMSESLFNYYFSAWKGCVIASNLHLRLTYGDTPWGMMSKIGGTRTMRGYWEGRYNDKCSADATMEFRQHIYRRSGAVAWIGVGEVFNKPSQIFKGHPLPNFGIGYRWEFKKRINIRIDYGFGRNQSAIVFNINEAF